MRCRDAPSSHRLCAASSQRHAASQPTPYAAPPPPRCLLLSHSYEAFAEDTQPGDMLVVDGGMVSLEVVSKAGPDVVARVVDPGEPASWRSRLCQLPAVMHRACMFASMLPAGPSTSVGALLLVGLRRAGLPPGARFARL